MGRKNIFLGDFLIEQKLISDEDLRQGLKHHKQTGKLLGHCLIELGFLDEKTLIDAISEQMGVHYVSLKKYNIDPEVIQLIPEEFCRNHKVFPLFKIDKKLTVGMVNPLDIIAIDSLTQITKLQIEPVVCQQQDIEDTINTYYQGGSNFDDAVKLYGDEGEEEDLSQQEESILRSQAQEGPVIKLVNMILSQAIKDGASDIHIQPREKTISVKYRIDGILHEIFSPPKSMQLAIASRIKIISSLNIAERRLPQDGRFRIDSNGHRVDFRVSTFPTAHGENVVARLLDSSSGVLKYEELGFSPRLSEDFGEMIHKPYGIVLVTGPTGSGKTSSLYSALSDLDSPEKNIITVEDPIEYNLDTIRQAQINNKIGMTFATGFRAILRQDPDIVMVGEIRDFETGDIAIRAALTGHLVLSTLHTNDAAGAVTRLVDMGIEPFLVASSVQGVLAQRLVRRICKYCAEEYNPEEKLVKMMSGLSRNGGQKKFIHGKGCNRCKNTGYKGRLGIFELLKVDEEIKRLVNKKSSPNEIYNSAKQHGMKTMIEDGLEKVNSGRTTIEEIFRVTQV